MVGPPRCYRKGFLSFTSTCYSKEFWEEVENAIITMAVIKAFGVGKKSERYLGVVKKVVRGLKDV